MGQEQRHHLVADPFADDWLREQGPVGHFVAAIGTGMAWTSQPVSPTPVDEQVKIIDSQMKTQFDPTGRLNPGLKPGV